MFSLSSSAVCGCEEESSLEYFCIRLKMYWEVKNNWEAEPSMLCYNNK